MNVRRILVPKTGRKTAAALQQNGSKRARALHKLWPAQNDTPTDQDWSVYRHVTKA